MSVQYNREWICPLLGDHWDIRGFWVKNMDRIKFIGSEPCVYYDELIGDDLRRSKDPLLKASFDYPDVVFYALRCSQVDGNSWWNNIVAYHGDYVVISEYQAQDWAPVWCDVLTICDIGEDDEVSDWVKSNYFKMPDSTSDKPPEKDKDKYWELPF